MRKTAFILTGLMLLSTAIFAETFGGGGYAGTVLEPITIEDLQEATPNQYVIVEGYLIQQRVPGTYILASDTEDPEFSVIVHFNPYNWANLDIDGETPVLVYGIVDRSELSIEVIGKRIEVQAEE
jgi:uncharacterized protein YdeI (BOF family)